MQSLSMVSWVLLVTLGFAAASPTGECQVGGPVFMGACLNHAQCQGRNAVIYISFPHQFGSRPNVVPSLTYFDSYNGATNARISVVAENITPLGFNLRFTSWADTYIIQAGAAWIACT